MSTEIKKANKKTSDQTTGFMGFDIPNRKATIPPRAAGPAAR